MRTLVIFFGVIIKKQTYRNGLYLLLTFPLGIVYIIFLMLGWFLGYGLVSGGWQSLFHISDLMSNIKSLAVVLGGILVWLLMVITCWLPTWIEKYLAKRLLGVNFHPSFQRFSLGREFWASIWTYFSDPGTWKSVVFIALKFPLGIALFTMIIGLLSAASGMLLAPLARLIGYKSFIIGPWRIDTWSETFIASVIGIFALPFSLHLLNWLALAAGWFARVMLSSSHKTITSHGSE